MTLKFIDSSKMLPWVTENEEKKKTESRRIRITNSDFVYGEDFFSFGRSYFDGGSKAAAYRQYQYDGRFKPGIKQFAEQIPLSEASAILELGCAKGYILYEFFNSGYRNIHGVDLSEYAINQAPKAIRDRLICSDALDYLVSTDQDFDLIISKEMLPHVASEKIDHLLNQIAQSTKKNGLVYLEIQTASDEASETLIKKFDPTHQTILNKSDWVARISKSQLSDKNTVVYLKNIA